MHQFVNAHNPSSVMRRGGGSALLHASPNPPVPDGPTAGRYRAVCGTLVRNVTRVRWNPRGPGRRCPACVSGCPE